MWNVEIPAPPDHLSPETAPRRSRSLLIGLLASLAWLAGSSMARRTLGWFLPRGAKAFFLLGWIPILGLGLAMGALLRDRLSRWNAGLPLVVIRAGHAVDRHPDRAGREAAVPAHAIPGHPWLAVSAAPMARPTCT